MSALVLSEIEVPFKMKVLTQVTLLVVWQLAKLNESLVPLFFEKEILKPVLLSFEMEVPLNMKIWKVVPWQCSY